MYLFISLWKTWKHWDRTESSVRCRNYHFCRRYGALAIVVTLTKFSQGRLVNHRKTITESACCQLKSIAGITCVCHSGIIALFTQRSCNLAQRSVNTPTLLSYTEPNKGSIMPLQLWFEIAWRRCGSERGVTCNTTASASHHGGCTVYTDIVSVLLLPPLPAKWWNNILRPFHNRTIYTGGKAG